MKGLTRGILVLFLVVSVISFAFAGAANPSINSGKVPTRTLEVIHKGAQAVRQEFVWDDATGTFQTVNLYTIGEVEDHVANVNDLLSRGAAGSGDLVGQAKDYTYWDGEKWVTLQNITRYEGEDARKEGIVKRYDRTFYTYSTSYWTAVTGTQTLYRTWIETRTFWGDIGGRETVWFEYYTRSAPSGYVLKTGTFSKLIEVPAAYDPVTEIHCANGWNVTIYSNYTTWGNQVKIQSPDGKVTYVYGDPHLSQAGGTQQQELAAIGEYVFDLGGYTLNLSCMQSRGGFSLVTDLSLTGPNGYKVTYGRNNEVKVEGGTR